MNISHQFGGSWTEDKLNRLKKYLEAYMKIFKGNVKASWFTTIYVDAFAGTGYRKTRQNYDPYLSLFGDEDVVSYQRGSAYTALEI